MREDQAELLAIRALEWLSKDEDRIGAFLGASGLTVGDLSEMAGSAEALAAVLDFILSEDVLVLGLAEALSCPPEHIARARAGLPGGDLPHWT